MNEAIFSIQNRIDLVILQAKELQDLESFKNQDFINEIIKYAIILLSGYIEKTVKEIYIQFSGSFGKEFQFFCQEMMSTHYGSKNFKKDEILNLAKKFSGDEKEHLTQLFDERQPAYGAAITNIIKNRNILAHGGNIAISLKDLQDYYTKTKKMLQEMRKIYRV